jgi:hypothetical protein
MSNIDLGNAPTGTPPTTGEQRQIRKALGIDVPTIENFATDYTLTAPTGTFQAGEKMLYHLKSTSGGSLSLSGITTPSDSLISFPKTLVSEETYVSQISYVNSGWRLITFVGGY